MRLAMFINGAPSPAPRSQKLADLHARGAAGTGIDSSIDAIENTGSAGRQAGSGSAPSGVDCVPARENKQATQVPSGPGPVGEPAPVQRVFN